MSHFDVLVRSRNEALMKRIEGGNMITNNAIQTELMPVPPAANMTSSVPLLRFPRLYIIATNNENQPKKLAVYNLETVPGPVFDSWFKSIIHEYQVRDAALITMVQSFGSWNTRTMWTAINALAEYGIDMSRCLFVGVEQATRALQARQAIRKILLASDTTKERTNNERV